MTDKSQNNMEAILSNPLSEITRRERRSLLGLSAIGLAMALTHFLPSEITAMSFKFDASDTSNLLRLVAGIIIYYLIAFILYFRSDYIRWKLAIREIQDCGDRLANDIEAGSVDGFDDAQKKRKFDLYDGLNKSGKARGIFEFYIPILIALCSVGSLLTTSYRIKNSEVGVALNRPGCYQLQPVQGKIYKINTCNGSVEEYIVHHKATTRMTYFEGTIKRK